MRSDKTISIVIRVRNAERDLRRCLAGLKTQRLPVGHELEIIVVDNESKDGSVDVAREYRAAVVPLATQDFSWGRALNRGISAAAGAIILILSADAYPADNDWICEMLSPFENESIAAVYGRQLPRPDAPIDEVIRLKKVFGETTKSMNSIPEGYSSRGGNFPVSNACAAIRRSIWEKLPYDELISGGEEGIWTCEALHRGYGVVYQASACVYHSHKDSLLRSCWRHLELLKKNSELAGKRVSALTYFRYALGIMKRRLSNCLYPQLDWKHRIQGLIMLPCEALLFVVSACFFSNAKRAAKYRSFFWDN